MCRNIAKGMTTTPENNKQKITKLYMYTCACACMYTPTHTQTHTHIYIYQRNEKYVYIYIYQCPPSFRRLCSCCPTAHLHHIRRAAFDEKRTFLARPDTTWAGGSRMRLSLLLRISLWALVMAPVGLWWGQFYGPPYCICYIAFF